MSYIEFLRKECLEIGICPNCKRKIPSKRFITKNGCLWCDKMFHKENKK